MSTGGNISTILTLDASKFVTALEKAATNLSTFDKNLSNATKIANEFEKNVSGLGSGVTAASDKFKMLDQTINSFVTKLSAAANKFDKLSSSTRQVKKATDEFAAGLNPLSRTFSTITSDTDKMRVAMDSLKPSIREAAEGQKTLAKANTTAANSAKDAAKITIEADVAKLENQKKTNAQRIANEEKTIAQLAGIERDFRNKAVNAQVAADNVSNTFFGKNKNSPNAQKRVTEALNVANRNLSNADTIRAEANARSLTKAAIQNENVELEKSIVLVKARAAAEASAATARRDAMIKSIAEEKAANEQIIASNRAANAAKAAGIKETARLEKEANDEHRRLAQQTYEEQKMQAKQVADMWKGIAGLWAASKIEHGLAKSVDSASDMERVKATVSAWNMGKEKESQFWQQTASLQKQVPQISIIDAAKANLAGMAGKGEFSSDNLAAVMPTIVKSVSNLATLFPESMHNIEDSVRNAMDMVAGMGAANDPKKAKEIIDVVQQAIITSGGKLGHGDVDMLLRRQGIGNIVGMDPQSLREQLEFAAQLKVMGHGSGGGSGGGVSSAGVIEKGMINFAQGGKKPTAHAISVLEDLGALTKTQVAHGDYAWKDSEKAAQNILKYMMEFGKNSIEKMVSDPKLRAKYFKPGEDYTNKDTQYRAYTRAFANIGSTNVSQGVSAMGNPEIADRIKTGVETSKSMSGVDKLQKDLSETYPKQVEKFEASMKTLSTTIGQMLLPVLTPLVEGLTNVLKFITDIGNQHGTSATLTLIGVATAGVALAVKSFMSFMGMPGKITSILTMMVPALRTAGVEAELAAGKVAKSGKSWLSLGGMIDGLKANFLSYDVAVKGATERAALSSSTGAATMGKIAGELGGKFRLLGTTISETAKFIGKSFLKMIPFLGELLIAWDFALLLSHVQVGGHEIGEWMGKWLDDLLTGGQMFWDKFIALFETGSAKIARLSKISQDEKDWRFRQKANGFGENADAPKDTRPTINDKPAKGQFNLGEYAIGYKAPAAPKTVTQEEHDAAQDKVKDKTRKSRDFEDMFLRSLAIQQGKDDISQLKLGTLTTGKESYKEQAMAEFKMHWLGGDFDTGHDPKNRLFLNDGMNTKNKKGVSQPLSEAQYQSIQSKGGLGLKDLDVNSDRKVKIGDETKKVKEWVAAWTEATEGQKLAADALKSNSFSIERNASTAIGAKNALEDITEGVGKRTAAMKALNREYAIEEARSPTAKNDALSDYSEFSTNKRDALTNQSSIDGAAVAADIVLKTESITAKLKSDAEGLLFTKEQVMVNELEATKQHEVDKFNTVKASLDKQIAEELKFGKEEEIAAITSIAVRKKLEEDYAAYVIAMNEQIAEAAKSPLQRQVDQWKSAYKDIEQTQADWANQMMSMVLKVTDGGFKNFKEFKNSIRTMLAGMLTDVSHMMVKKAMGGMIGQVAGMFGDGAKKLFGALGTDANPMTVKIAGSDGGTAGGQKSVDPQDTFFGKLSVGFSALWSGIKNMFGGVSITILNLFKSVGLDLTSIFKNLMSSFSGGSSGGGGILGTLFQAGMSYFGSLGGSEEGLSAAGGSWLPTTGSNYTPTGGAGISLFANGGIMSNIGEVSLKKYAAGGVANSPQMSMFGEAGPEAYVPLPDGRSIPVTMKGMSASSKGGDGSPNVTISIVVTQTGNGTGAESKTSNGDSQPWGKMANAVKSVVLSELIAQKRPGGILYK